MTSSWSLILQLSTKNLCRKISQTNDCCNILFRNIKHPTSNYKGTCDRVMFSWLDLCEVILFLSDVKWVTLKFLGTKVPWSLGLTLCWGYLMVLWLFYLGLSCNVVVLTCFVICGCVYVWVCVCMGFVMFGYVYVWVFW